MRGLGVVVVVLLAASACGESGPGGSTAGGATGGSGATAGSGMSTAGTGTSSGGRAGTAGGATIPLDPNGAAGATIALSPPASIDLNFCKSVSDDGSTDAYGACLDCCWNANFTLGAFFDGTCACNHGIEDSMVCAGKSTMGTECADCCFAANYFGASFAPGSPPLCTCTELQNESICKSAGGSLANCTVCCINAGYLSRSYDGACVCRDG